jgi:CO/xanthine dehydrogenase Mo-binding subunit
MPDGWVGRSVPRREGRDKVTGATKYVDDLHADAPELAGLLHGVTVRSEVPRGRIKEIRYEGDLPWDEIVVATAADIPGANEVKLIHTDQPLLADGVVNHCEEPIVLLAHRDREVVHKARRHVVVDIEPLPSIHSIEEALRGDTVIWGDDNVFTHYTAGRGDPDSVWDAAPHVLTGEYFTGAQEQMYIEVQGMIARFDPEEGVTVWGSLQCPYYVQTALCPLFELPPEKVRIVQMATGGGFGGKEEYPSILAGHAALLAHKSGKPVKMIYDRLEDVAATTKRHPSRTRIKSAFTDDGKLLALDIEFIIDGGAYITLSPVVLSRGTIHAAGPYACEHVRVDSKAVATSSPPHGAFRGFGAPQSIFALERHLDRMATQLQLDPAQLRRRNVLRSGQTTSVGQTIHESIDLSALIDRALEKADWAGKRKLYEEHNARGDSPLRRGLGLAVFYHGSGFTGAGEVHLASKAVVEGTADGRLRVLAASTEIGQGTNTVFSQIVADAAKVGVDRIEIVQPDTAHVPNSGPTVASRTCMVVGNLLAQATGDLLGQLRAAGHLGQTWTADELTAACKAWFGDHDELVGRAQYKPPAGVHWDDKAFCGDAYSAYAWACYVASVIVDTRTAEVRVDDFVAVQEIGQTVNPVLAGGQIEGGVAQAIGWAVYEDVVWKDGRVANPEMTNYIIPTAVDTPPIRVEFMPPYASDPVPKGIGELPMDGPAPAILNAVAHATGVDPCHVPLMPERLMDALHPEKA